MEKHLRRFGLGLHTNRIVWYHLLVFHELYDKNTIYENYTYEMLYENIVYRL